MNKRTKKGFTLVELVIVIAVIAILSAILIPTFGSIIKDANETKAKADLKAAITSWLAANANVTTVNIDQVNTAVFAEEASIAADDEVYVYLNGEVVKAKLKANASETSKYDIVVLDKDGKEDEANVNNESKVTIESITSGKKLETTGWYMFPYTTGAQGAGEGAGE